MGKEKKNKTDIAIQTMIAGLAHEIKNPLNSIKGASEYLNKKYSDIEDVYEFTKIIIEEIERLDKYINEFLSFSRGVKIKPKKVNIYNFLSGIVMTVKHSFPTEIKIYDYSEIKYAYLDPEQMRQVFVNLLSNSKDALKDTSSPEVKIVIKNDKRNIYISVIDNGHGIDSNYIKDIFLPFFTTKENGLGLGLTICKSIVEKHKGKISVKSELNKGCEFTIQLPIRCINET